MCCRWLRWLWRGFRRSSFRQERGRVRRGGWGGRGWRRVWWGGGRSMGLGCSTLCLLAISECRMRWARGGLWGAGAGGVGPTLLIGFALWAARGERVAGLPALGFAAIVAVAGPLVYVAARWGQRRVVDGRG